MSTSTQERSSSSRTLKCTPSAHRYAYWVHPNGRLRQASYSASQLRFSRQIVAADSPAAASPRIASRAVGKSLLLTPFEVQGGQRRLQGRGAAHEAGQDGAAERLVARLALRLPLIHPGSGHPHRPHPAEDRALGGMAVTHHLLPAPLVAASGVPLQVLLHLRLQRRLQQPLRALAGDPLDRLLDLTGGCILQPSGHTLSLGHTFLLRYLFCSTEGYAPFSSLSTKIYSTPRASAGWYSLIETAKANRVEPYLYLRTLPSRLPDSREPEAYRLLLPWRIEKPDLLDFESESLF